MKHIFSILLLASLPFFASGSSETEGGPGSAPSTSESLFKQSRVWNIHLAFTADEWEAITPLLKGGMGPGGFFAPGFIAAGDTDGDFKLSEKEFRSLGSKWFEKWKAEGSDLLDSEQIDQGIADVVNGLNEGKLILSASEGERNGIASMLGVEFPDSYCDMEFEDQKFESVSVRHKGNGTYLNAGGTEKFSFKLDLNDGFKGRELAGIVKLNLHNCITDPSYMNEVLAYQLYRDAGVPAPRTSYTRLYVSVSHQFGLKFLGLYSIVENVDKRFISDRFGDKKGPVFKPVTPFLFKDLGPDWSAYRQIYDPKTSVSEEEKWRLIDLCRLVTHASDEEFAARIGTFLDVDELARFLAVTVLLCDLDGLIGPGQNFYMYLSPETNKFIFIPWDQDHSFGQMKRTQEYREKLSIERPWENNNPFLERLFGVEAFRDTYMAHLKQMNDTLYVPDRINQQVDKLALVLRESVEEESAEKLELFDQMVTWDFNEDETLVSEATIEHGNPGMFGSEAGVLPVKGFVYQRRKSVDSQLKGESTGLQDENTQDIGDLITQRGISSVFLKTMDANEDNRLSSEEFERGFENWFIEWKGEETETVDAIEIKAGLNIIIGSL